MNTYMELASIGKFLPHTNRWSLQMVVVILAALCAAEAIASFMMFAYAFQLADLVIGGFFLVLGVYLWLLNAFARAVAVFLLWLVVIVLPLGVLNPFMASDMAAAGRELNIWYALAALVPLVAMACGALHILDKHKREFSRTRRRPDK